MSDHYAEKKREKRVKSPNVKLFSKYSQNEENFRYMTLIEWQKFLGVIDHFKHKLIMRLLYELGCRVGELVKIQLKHLDFNNSSIYFPAENTKTKHARTSHIPEELMNDVKTQLRQERRMAKRSDRILKLEDFLFKSSDYRTDHITENRVRQIFQKYIKRCELDREYGYDKLGRRLRKFTVHSLRHTHCMHYIHIYKLPVPIVQRQVGHKTLKATMVYCQPNDEMVREEYGKVRRI
ncbi:site-specific integrase [bacterium]|nr:site-specific integrase [bacterium]